jgi:hypothetical protein
MCPLANRRLTRALASVVGGLMIALNLLLRRSIG